MELALQTFTVRKSQKKDVFGTLERCKAMGYSSFEMSRFDFNEKTLRELRRAKDQLGVRYLNFQKTMDCLSSNFEMAVRFCKELDCHVVCISVLPLEFIFKGPKQIQRFCDKANELFDRFNEKGILLTYHTHDFEYVNVDGYCAIETIAKNIKTPLVIDAYWATRAGRNVEQLLSQLSGKVYALHLKDYNCTKNLLKRSCEPVALGEGVLPIGSIVEASENANLSYVAIEHHSKDPFREMAVSMDYLKTHDLLKEFQ